MSLGLPPYPTASNPIPKFDRLSDLAFTEGYAVTPSDTVGLDNGTVVIYARALYIGVTGDVEVTLISGTKFLFKAVPAGTILHAVTVQVWATGTTATNIVALR